MISLLDQLGSCRLPYPYRQGELDALSGIYAVVNAIGTAIAAHHALDITFARCLFRVAVTHVAQRSDMATILIDGMKPALVEDLVRQLAQTVSEATRIALSVERVPPNEATNAPALEQIIDKALDAGAIALVSLSKPYRHYTVIVAHTPRYYRLRDSDGQRALPKASSTQEAGGDDRGIDPQCVMILRVADIHETARPPP